MQTSGLSQMMVQMTMIVTQYLHHVETCRQFWTEQQMVLTSMSQGLLSNGKSCSLLVDQLSIVSLV